MTKRQALETFRREILPSLDARYSKTDVTARREAWNSYTDMLCKDGQITLHQYETWHGPFLTVGVTQ